MMPHALIHVSQSKKGVLKFHRLWSYNNNISSLNLTNYTTNQLPWTKNWKEIENDKWTWS